MARPTEPLRKEHAELLPQVESLKDAADALSQSDSARQLARVEEAYAFLAEHLIPHATAEDKALYPVVARLMGSEAATRTMSRDHVAVGVLTEELGSLLGSLRTTNVDEKLRNELRRVLYGLYTLVSVHFAKEEEVYLPILDEKLDEATTGEMFESMEKAAALAKGQHH